MKTYKQFQEGIKTKLALGALATAPFIMGQIQKRFDPVGKQRKKTQDKKATEYEKRSGTSKEDGYFR